MGNTLPPKRNKEGGTADDPAADGEDFTAAGLTQPSEPALHSSPAATMNPPAALPQPAAQASADTTATAGEDGPLSPLGSPVGSTLRSVPSNLSLVSSSAASEAASESLGTARQTSVSLPASPAGSHHGRSVSEPADRVLLATASFRSSRSGGSQRRPFNLQPIATDSSAVVDGDYDEDGILITEEHRKTLKLAQFSSECSDLAPGLSVSGCIVASDAELLQSCGVTVVVNCAADAVANKLEGQTDWLSYWTLYLLDAPTQDIASLFSLFVHLVECEVASNGRVLVHCHQGVSRSGALAIAYIMWKNGCTFNDALDDARGKRGTISPNPGFICQLLEWYQLLDLLKHPVFPPLLYAVRPVRRPGYTVGSAARHLSGNHAFVLELLRSDDSRRLERLSPALLTKFADSCLVFRTARVVYVLRGVSCADDLFNTISEVVVREVKAWSTVVRAPIGLEFVTLDTASDAFKQVMTAAAEEINSWLLSPRLVPPVNPDGSSPSLPPSFAGLLGNSPSPASTTNSPAATAATGTTSTTPPVVHALDLTNARLGTGRPISLPLMTSRAPAGEEVSTPKAARAGEGFQFPARAPLDRLESGDSAESSSDEESVGASLPDEPDADVMVVHAEQLGETVASIAAPLASVGVDDLDDVAECTDRAVIGSNEQDAVAAAQAEATAPADAALTEASSAAPKPTMASLGFGLRLPPRESEEPPLMRRGGDEPGAVAVSASHHEPEVYVAVMSPVGHWNQLEEYDSEDLLPSVMLVVAPPLSTLDEESIVYVWVGDECAAKGSAETAARKHLAQAGVECSDSLCIVVQNADQESAEFWELFEAGY